MPTGFLNTVNSDIRFVVFVVAIFIIGTYAILDSAFVDIHINNHTRAVYHVFSSLVHNSRGAGGGGGGGGGVGGGRERSRKR